jgi:hypothetical protein
MRSQITGQSCSLLRTANFPLFPNQGCSARALISCEGMGRGRRAFGARRGFRDWVRLAAPQNAPLTGPPPGFGGELRYAPRRLWATPRSSPRQHLQTPPPKFPAPI